VCVGAEEELVYTYIMLHLLHFFVDEGRLAVLEEVMRVA
jgi:hypothetical protein